MASKFKMVFLLPLACAVLWWLGAGQPAIAAPMIIFVSVLPQQEIVQHIGGDRVDVQVMVPPGASPHTYEPKPAQMAALAKTRIYFSVGMPFESVWLPRFTAVNRDMQVVATDRGISKIPMAHHENEGESHAHDAAILDPHIWLAPPLIKIMAGHICDALTATDPAHTDQYKQRYETLLHILDALDQRIRNLLADKKGARFMVFHPSWGYFAQTYGLVQIPLEIEGKEPKPAQLQHLIREAKAMQIRVIFAQPQFSRRSAELISEAIGGRVVMADPLAADLLDNLWRQAQAFKETAQ